MSVTVSCDEDVGEVDEVEELVDKTRYDGMVRDFGVSQ